MGVVRRLIERSFPFDPSAPDAQARRTDLVREASVMVLYLSVVLLATLGVLPDDYGHASGDGSGGPPIGLIVWGTTVGLALAHWFAFRLATAALGDGKPSRHDMSLGLAQLFGAALVAVATTLAIAIAPATSEVRIALFVPATFIGAAGYGVAHAAGRSRGSSIGVAIVALFLGLAVAGVKVLLGGR